MSAAVRRHPAATVAVAVAVTVAAGAVALWVWLLRALAELDGGLGQLDGPAAP